MNTVFCIAGRTCAGKDTIASNLCERFPELFSKVISYTTRPMRDNETNGVEHWFINKEEFDKLKEEHEVVAYTKIGDYEYMALKESLEDSNIYIIDPDGINYLKENFPEIPLFVIAVMADKEERKRRVLHSNRDANASKEEILKNFEVREAAEDQQFSRFEKNHEYDIAVSTDKNLTNEELLSLVDASGIILHIIYSENSNLIGYE